MELGAPGCMWYQGCPCGVMWWNMRQSYSRLRRRYRVAGGCRSLPSFGGHWRIHLGRPVFDPFPRRHSLLLALCAMWASATRIQNFQLLYPREWACDGRARSDPLVESLVWHETVSLSPLRRFIEELDVLAQGGEIPTALVIKVPGQNCPIRWDGTYGATGCTG